MVLIGSTLLTNPFPRWFGHLAHICPPAPSPESEGLPTRRAPNSLTPFSPPISTPACQGGRERRAKRDLGGSAIDRLTLPNQDWKKKKRKPSHFLPLPLVGFASTKPSSVD